jgi:hypothetical protein
MLSHTVFTSETGFARDQFQAKKVVAIDGIVKCLWARDRWITVISGPCDDYRAPRQVRVGETFLANGAKKTINVVVATRHDDDFPAIGVKAGDWTCTATESLADLPGHSEKKDHTGTWLYLAKCRPQE